jgi:hypothetical protein
MVEPEDDPERSADEPDRSPSDDPGEVTDGETDDEGRTAAAGEGEDDAGEGSSQDVADAATEDRRAGNRRPWTDEDSTHSELDRLWSELEGLETRVEEDTVPRSEVEADLRRYVRQRMRRGHAQGWGPYLIFLYATAMTLGAFFYLEGVFAILALVVVWLSALGLYVLFLFVGLGLFGVRQALRASERFRS